MMKHLVMTLIVATTVMIQACSKLKKPSPEESCNFQQNSYKQRVSWSNLPVKLYAHHSLSDEQVLALQEAIDIWNTVRTEEWGVSENFFELQDDDYTGAEFGDDRKSVVSITTDWRGESREQAETVLRWEDNWIIDADIRLNGNKPLSVAEPIGFNEIDLVALYVHELGHALGLIHIDSPEYTVMGFELERGNNKRRVPGNLELDALRCEY